jgi:hypothetical protein
MTQRLVDVLDRSGKILHTYPITLGEPADGPMTLRTKQRRWRRPRTAT